MVAQANAPLDEKNRFVPSQVLCRVLGRLPAGVAENVCSTWTSRPSSSCR
jgi:hypothetical protein